MSGPQRRALSHSPIRWLVADSGGSRCRLQQGRQRHYARLASQWRQQQQRTDRLETTQAGRDLERQSWRTVFRRAEARIQARGSRNGSHRLPSLVRRNRMDRLAKRGRYARRNLTSASLAPCEYDFAETRRPSSAKAGWRVSPPSGSAALSPGRFASCRAACAVSVGSSASAAEHHPLAFDRCRP